MCYIIYNITSEWVNKNIPTQIESPNIIIPISVELKPQSKSDVEDPNFLEIIVDKNAVV